MSDLKDINMHYRKGYQFSGDTKPLRRFNILDDFQSGYRALSFCLLGNENYFVLVRRCINEYIALNKRISGISRLYRE